LTTYWFRAIYLKKYFNIYFEMIFEMPKSE